MKKTLIIASLMPFLAACSGNPPTDIGLKDQTLTACPDKPNCVSSYAEPSDEDHAIKPLMPPAGGNIQSKWEALPSVLKGMDIKIVEQSDTYIRAEATTTIMRYVDDLEFYLDKDAGVIQVRSASRLGYSDLGKNRSRLEEIRAAL